MGDEEIFAQLKQAVIDQDQDAVLAAVDEALAEGSSPRHHRPGPAARSQRYRRAVRVRGHLPARAHAGGPRLPGGHGRPRAQDQGERQRGPQEGQDRARHGQGRPALDRQEHPQAPLRDLGLRGVGPRHRRRPVQVRRQGQRGRRRHHRHVGAAHDHAGRPARRDRGAQGPGHARQVTRSSSAAARPRRRGPTRSAPTAGRAPPTRPSTWPRGWSREGPARQHARRPWPPPTPLRSATPTPRSTP